MKSERGRDNVAAILLQSRTGLRVFKPPIELPEFDVELVWHERTHKSPGLLVPIGLAGVTTEWNPPNNRRRGLWFAVATQTSSPVRHREPDSPVETTMMHAPRLAAASLPLLVGICTVARADDNRSAAVQPNTGEPSRPDTVATSAARTQMKTTWFFPPLPARGLTILDGLLELPGASVDRRGVGLDGTTSLETRSFLAGLETTAVRLGGLGSNYLRELIETATIEGNRVRMVPRQVGNTTRSSVFGYLAPGFAAGAVDQPVSAETLVARRRPQLDSLVGARIATPIGQRASLSLAGGFRRVETAVDRIVQRQTDCREVLPNGGLSRCDPLFADGSPDRDRDGNLLLETVDSTELSDTLNQAQVLGRLEVEPGAGHALSIVAGGIFSRAIANGIRGEPSAVSRKYAADTTDAVARWTVAVSDRTEIDLSAGWHRRSDVSGSMDSRADSRPRTDHLVLGYSAGAQISGDTDAARRGCIDSIDPRVDPHPFIENCPFVGSVATGGPGRLIDDVEGRAVASAGASRWWGAHRLSARAGAARRYAHVSRALSGGQHIHRSLFYTTTTQVIDDATSVSADALSAELQDEWKPAPSVFARGSVRLERENISGTESSLPLASVSPAVFASYRPDGDAPWTVYGEVARRSDPVPLDLAVSSLSRARNHVLECDDAGACRRGVFSSSEPADLDSTVAPPTSDTAVIGFHSKPAGGLEIGAQYRHRDQSFALEDVVDGPARELTNPDARRTHRSLVTTADLLTSSIGLRASYALSSTRGNYEGLVSSLNGQFAPHTSSAFDDPSLMVNADGLLPQDRRHRVVAEAWGRHELGSHEIGAGARARLESGAPTSALGRHETYGWNEVFLVPRGSLGRRAPGRAIDVRLAYTYRNSVRPVFELFVDVFDVLDQQDALSIDQTYTFDATQAIVGGGYEDLVFAKQVDDSRPIGRNPGFGEVTRRATPIAARLGLRLTF